MTAVLALGAVQVATGESAESSVIAKAVIDKYGSCFGAAAMDASKECPPANSGQVVPRAEVADDDLASAYHQGCVTMMPWERVSYRSCVYGDPKATVDIALVGNSHAIHYLPAMQEIAAARHWKITTFLANKCFPTTERLKVAKQPQENCLNWGKWVLDATTRGGFDLVVTSNREGPQAAAAEKPADNYGIWKRGFSRYLDSWLDGGARVLAIRDTPYPGHTVDSVPTCVAAHKDNFKACAADRTEWLRPDPLTAAVTAARSPRAQVADLSNYFCASQCLPVIGSAVVYRDDSHLTATFSRTLAPYLAPYVDRALASAGTGAAR